MNEFESELVSKTMESLHDLELKMTQGFAEVRGDIKNIEEKVEENGKKVDKQTDIETKRLDKHSAEIDANRDAITEIRTTQKNNKWWFISLAAWAAAVAAIAAIFIK